MEIGKGRPSDESASLAPLWPGLSLSLVLVCTSMVYFQVHWFSFLHKNQHSSLTWKQWTWRVTLWKVQCQRPIIIFFFFIIVVIKRDYCIGMNEEVLLSIFCQLFSVSLCFFSLVLSHLYEKYLKSCCFSSFL